MVSSFTRLHQIQERVVTRVNNRGFKHVKNAYLHLKAISRLWRYLNIANAQRTPIS